MKIVVREVVQGIFKAEIAEYTHNVSLIKGEGTSEKEAVGDLFIKNRGHPIICQIISISIELPTKREIPKPRDATLDIFLRERGAIP